MQTNHPIIIVGAGPAGLATALHLVQRAPHMGKDILLLEAAEHPRNKLCGGGITVHGEDQLTRLGVRIDVPSFVVNKIVFRLGVSEFVVNCHAAMRVIQRHAFDAALAQAVADRGIRLHSNEAVRDVVRSENGVEVITTCSHYKANVVIAADGSNSLVRRKLRPENESRVARLLRILTPVEPIESQIWRQAAAVFDFSCVSQGVNGYAWDFPCVLDGAPHVNRGIFDSRINADEPRVRGLFKRVFAERLAEQGLEIDDFELKGHPVRWYRESAEFALPHVLFVGDAAGVDPLFAEGISFAMEYGELAANEVINACRHNSFEFDEYTRNVHKSALGQLLRRRLRVAHALYEPRNGRLWQQIWRLAAIAPTRIQQHVGASLGVLPRA
jgi:flavin-dependent dehydrogenase